MLQLWTNEVALSHLPRSSRQVYAQEESHLPHLGAQWNASMRVSYVLLPLSESDAAWEEFVTQGKVGPGAGLAQEPTPWLGLHEFFIQPCQKLGVDGLWGPL